VKVSELLIAAALAASAGTASAEPMNLKPGLWETTEKVEAGASVAGALGRLVKGADKLPVGADTSRGVTVKRCISAEDLKRDNWFSRDKDPSCKFTVTTSSPTAFVGSRQCGSKVSHAADVEIRSSDPEHWTGSVKSKVTSGGKDQTTTLEMSGKWLAADCGAKK
jgi:uncharacterized protein DUF3617